MNDLIISKSNPLKNMQATDSDNRNVGSSKGGKDPSQFT